MSRPPDDAPGAGLSVAGLLRAVGMALKLAGVLILVFFLSSLLLFPTKRIVTLEAIAEGIEIEFLGPDHPWSIEGALLCAPGQTGRSCADTRDTISWPDGARIALTWPPGTDMLQITILEDLPGLSAQSRFEIPAEAFRRNGQLVFRGYAVIGAEPGSGREGYLREGRYRFFERDSLALRVGRGADIVREGELVRGDRVVVTCMTGGKDAGCATEPDPDSADEGPRTGRMLVFGHVVLESHSAGSGIAIALTSTQGDVALRIERYGLGPSPVPSVERTGLAALFGPAGAGRGEYLTIRPNFVDVIIASPSFVAITLIVSFIAAIIQPMLPATPGSGFRDASGPGAPEPAARRKPEGRTD